MTTWNQKYLNDAIADEIKLAALKLRRRVSAPVNPTIATDLYSDPPKSSGFMSAGHVRQSFARPLPRWRRDWRAAGPLVTELGLVVRPDDEEGTVSVGPQGRRRSVTESFSDHPDKDAATMAAIVRAAIQVITEARECS